MSIPSPSTSLTPHITLDEEVAGRLLDRIVPLRYAPTAWPTEPGPADAALAPLRVQLRDILRDGPGWAVVDTGLAHRGDDEVGSATWNLFTALTRPVPQYRTGELVHLVEVSDGPAQAASTYSQTNRSGSFHTDGTLLPQTPEVAMLSGISSADDGGETIVIDGDAIIARLLADAPEHLAVLEQPQPYHSGDDADPVVLHPVVDRSGPWTAFRFNILYVGLGYAKRGEEVPAALTAALEALDALANDAAYQKPTLIARGQMLIWNNLRCLHGRRSFTERQHQRRLLRAYGLRFPTA